MAARLLLLLVLIMLVLAALYGYAQASSFADRQEQRAATQEAAKDRQPMKGVHQPTTAQITLQAPEESDHHIRRAKAGVVVRAGKNPAVVARAGQSVVRVGAFKTAKGEDADATVPSRREVTLRIEGLKIVLEGGEEHEHSAH